MSAQCPTCWKDLVVSKAVWLHPHLAGVLRRMQIPCDFVSTQTPGCQQKVPLCKLELRTAQCLYRPGAAPYESQVRVYGPVGESAHVSGPCQMKDLQRRVTHNPRSAKDVSTFFSFRPQRDFWATWKLSDRIILVISVSRKIEISEIEHFFKTSSAEQHKNCYT